MKRKIIAVLVIFLAAGFFLFADASEIKRETSFSAVAAYYPPNWAGYETSGFAPVRYEEFPGADPSERSLGSTWGGAEGKVSLSHTVTVPALRGDHFLVSGNNAAFKFTGELSPVSLNAVFEASLTPAAFLKFSAGAGIGTGFSFGFVGLASNPADSIEPLKEEPLGGAVYRLWASGTLQFDFAAVFPGDWNHVVFQITPSVEYKAYTGAGPKDAWLWEADKGENFNGLKFKGTYFLGYQMPLMPLRINMAGFLLETEEWIGSVRGFSPMASGWGSDFVSLNFGPLANITLTDRSSLAVLVQFKTARDYTDSSTRERSFQERDYEGSFLYFNRVALSYSLKL